LGGAIVAGPAAAQEPGRLYRVGCLGLRAPGAQPAMSVPFVVFFAALEKLGFVAGRNLAIDKDGLTLRSEEMAPHAQALARAGVDVIFAASGDVSIRAAAAATRTIPILAIADDLMGSGFVRSLARPGGNITGVSILSTELDQKRQDLLLELVPGARRIAALLDPHTEAPRRLADLVQSAAAQGVAVEFLRVTRPEEIAPGLDRAREAGCTALNVLASPLFYGARQALIAGCAALRLPAIYHLPEMAEDGGLIAYGPRIVQIFRDLLPRLFQRLVAGTKPADLPVERPTQLDLVVNLKTAKALGLAVPELLLARASDVIE
jgi:putative ABC transport system substrate-binding protein